MISVFCPSQNHSKVLELLNQQLSHVASSPSPPHSDRERLQTLAITIAERYRNQGHNAGRQLSQTFFLLLDIMQFFDHYHSKRIDIALDVSHLSSCNVYMCCLYIRLVLRPCTSPLDQCMDIKLSLFKIMLISLFDFIQVRGIGVLLGEQLSLYS